MQEYLNANFFANQIRMRRSSYEGTFIIVEGRYDRLVYGNIFNEEKCDFTVSYGKEKAIDIIKILNKDNLDGVLAIVDADFSRLEENHESLLNVLLTDEHDLETMMIKSPAFDKLMKERGGEQKIQKFTQDIRNHLLKTGKNIGYLRWISLQNNLALKFEGLNYSKFVNNETLLIDDIIKFIKTVKDHSQKPNLDEINIKQKIEKLENNNHDLWQICCGHDLICILSIGLCKKWGSWDTNKVKPEDLERELRLAYEKDFFTTTELYQLIQHWENNNSPYKILYLDGNKTEIYQAVTNHVQQNSSNS
ncbi:conserved hypothetical protein [Rippkaea orientalis PCC 8801]|uniref:DUF4435 domain-containing protein n=1 Tax=Rippkaea orientalis (strain PCC 8801 / RF-1) TaxID=41431 RepID=B7JXG1_RIPO1|nr:DUF4435 domain-containing protein [Rippkaea orientalis]ACK64718.1 conserved hypothetical protein [Rippkaea orientalis PCC 8801]